jgi:hypothetical protein
VNIYTKNQQEIRKIILSFIKTIYGKTMFLLSYSMFFVFLVQAIIVLVLHENRIIFFMLSFLSLLSIIFGSINYYKELRTYVKERKQD